VLHPAFLKCVSAQVPIHQLVYTQTPLLKPTVSPVLKWVQIFQEQTKELSCCLVRNFRKAWYSWYMWSLTTALLLQELSSVSYCYLSNALKHILQYSDAWWTQMRVKFILKSHPTKVILIYKIKISMVSFKQNFKGGDKA